MTREEAIKFANCLKNNYTIDFNDMADFCEMAIKALQQQASENEKIIRISKGTLKARTGKYVIYDVEWLKTHFNTTEAKIYGQPSDDWNAVLDELNRIGRNAFKDDTDYDNLFDFISNLPNVTPQPKTEGARGDIPLQQSVPKMPQSEKRTEERTETHECDYISRKAVLDALHSYFAEGFNEDRWWNSTHVLNAINKVPSIAPQPKEEPQQKTGHWVLSGGYWRCSECKEKALLKLDKATGGYREYEPVRSKYCPYCGAKMQEEKK